jgi:membrane-associated phospholipid phosphatase
MLFLTHDHSRLLMPRVWASLFLTLLVCLVCMLSIDRPVLLLVHNELPSQLQQFFSSITWLGEGNIWLIVSGAVAVIGYLLQRFGKSSTMRKQGKAFLAKGVFIFSSIVFSGLLLNIVKIMIGRLRPSFFLTDGTYGFQPFNFNYGTNTFPSGHSQAVWALMTSLSLLYPRFTIPFVSFATLIAASRVLVSAHYLSDVLMGSYLGIILTLYLYTRFVRMGYLRREQTGAQNQAH